MLQAGKNMKRKEEAANYDSRSSNKPGTTGLAKYNSGIIVHQAQGERINANILKATY